MISKRKPHVIVKTMQNLGGVVFFFKVWSSTNGLACWFGAQLVVWGPRIGVRAPRLPIQESKPLNAPNQQLSNEKNLGWLGYTRDDILPSYIGIIINHYKDPY